MTLLQRKRSADIEIKWATLYAESALFQYDVTRTEIKNMVLTESCEDADILMESAWSTVKDKLIEAIKKIFEGADKIISYVADKIQELFKSKDLEKKKKVLDEVKKIPEAKNVKVEIGLVKGKHTYDKKETLKLKDAEREMKRDIKNYSRLA